MENKKKARVIAYYLPQFHPIPENDKWWGNGFTEWTNVGRARPLFYGHYQPRVPADLGYYDLRLSEVREAQAEMASNAGIEGFCYYHYWFSGKQLLERPFNDVLNSKKPDFPFCLCWANHSWEEKTWVPNGKNKILIKQQYLGDEDHINHFNSLREAFQDNRYIKIDNKPLFVIYAPYDISKHDIKLWNDLALRYGFSGIYFVAVVFKEKDIDDLLLSGYNAVIYDLMFKRKSMVRLMSAVTHKYFKMPYFIDYRDYTKTLLCELPIMKNIYPCIIPNYDHTPRSGSRGSMFINSTPENWSKLILLLLEKMSLKKYEENIIFLKSWNEWGEGNYMEPDLRYGKRYLEVLRDCIVG